MSARTILLVALLATGPLAAAPGPEVPPLKRLRSAQEMLARGDVAGLGDLIGLLTEGPIDVAWQAEELLRWVAGPAAPKRFIEGGDKTNREQAQAAWREWHNHAKGRTDWKAVLEEKTTRPGLMLVCTRHDVRLIGFDGTIRWFVTVVNALDAHVLADGRVLVLTADKLGEYDAAGGRTWECNLPIFKAISCQPLEDDRVFVASSQELLLIDRDRKIVSRRKSPIALEDARLLKNGQIVCLATPHVEWYDGFTDKRLARTVTGGGLRGRLHPLGEDRLLIHLADWGNIYAIGIKPGSERQDWADLAFRPLSVSPLPGGNFLCVQDWNGQLTLQEWTPRLKLVAEFVLPTETRLVKSCLDDLRRGLDHPRPRDYDRDTLAFRLEQLRSTSAEERRFAVAVLDQFTVNRDALIRAVIPRLSDSDEKVRAEARQTLNRLRSGRVGAETANDLVAAAMKTLRQPNQSPEERLQALRVLAETVGRKDAIEDAAVVDILTSALRDTDDVSLLAAEALGRCGVRARGAVPALLDIVRPGQQTCRSNELRRAALVALNQVRPERDAVLPVLKEILSQPKEDEKLRLTAVAVIQGVDPSLEKSLPFLGELLMQRGAGPSVLDEVGMVLAKRGGEKAVPALEWAVRHGNQDAALAALRALETLGWQARAAVPALKEAAQEEDPDIRAAAQKALRRVDPR
jgi:hypothetical protein